jgi:hypothetical protein
MQPCSPTARATCCGPASSTSPSISRCAGRPSRCTSPTSGTCRSTAGPRTAIRLPAGDLELRLHERRHPAIRGSPTGAVALMGVARGCRLQLALGLRHRPRSPLRSPSMGGAARTLQRLHQRTCPSASCHPRLCGFIVLR